MKQVKTYQYNGLYEWHGNIHMNGLEMALSFTGGNETAYGISPASYTTDNKNIQRFIEHSDEYRIGRIKLSHVTDVEDDEPCSEAKEDADESHLASTEGYETVEVSDKNEAIEYLKEHFGGEYTATRLRTKSAFDAACAECKVNFVFAN